MYSERIKQALKDNHITQAELAKMNGISQSTLSKRLSKEIDKLDYKYYMQDIINFTKFNRNDVRNDVR